MNFGTVAHLMVLYSGNNISDINVPEYILNVMMKHYLVVDSQ